MVAVRGYFVDQRIQKNTFDTACVWSVLDFVLRVLVSFFEKGRIEIYSFFY
jgi:hypothetical protein